MGSLDLLGMSAEWAVVWKSKQGWRRVCLMWLRSCTSSSGCDSCLAPAHPPSAFMAFVGFAISLQLSIYRKGLTKSASRMGVGAQASDDAPSADIDMTEVMKHVRETIDDEFADVDALLATPGAGSSRAATPSRGPGQNAKRRKRALAEEIAYWEKLEAEHEQKAGLLVHEGCPAHEFQLVQSREAIPKLLQQTQSRLQAVLDEAQSLSLQRHSLQDKLDGLVAETSSQARGQDGHPEEGHEPPGGAREGPTVLEQLDRLQDELGRLEAGLAWVSVLERVVALRSDAPAMPCTS